MVSVIGPVQSRYREGEVGGEVHQLHAVSVGKPSERVSNFWTVRFLKSESEPNFGFAHIPIHQCSLVLVNHSSVAQVTQCRESYG